MPISFFSRFVLECICHCLGQAGRGNEHKSIKLDQAPRQETVVVLHSTSWHHDELGTKARGWTCTKDSDYLEPLFGSEDLAKAQDYIEAHSSDAQTLRKVFDHMKRFPPVARRGIAQGDIQSPSNVAAGAFAGEGKGR